MNERLSDVWRQYRQGCQYLEMTGLFEKTDECYRMYEGDQWYGLQSGEERLPILNVIDPVIKYKASMVAQNAMSIHYSPMGSMGQEGALMQEVCDALNQHARKCWENMKLDSLSWELVLDSAICGDAYLYFYYDDGEIHCEAIDNTVIYFADEQQRDIQKQRYVIIAQRRPISDIKEEALENGLSEEEIELITADNETEHQAGDASKLEQTSDDGKCISLLKMWKGKDGMHFCRATKHVEYLPEQVVKGMGLYPIATLAWDRKKGSARAIGAVQPLIANQIEINKAQARLALSIKNSAYPTLAYVGDAVENPKELGVLGASIELSGTSAKQIDDLIKYIQPAQISPQAGDLVNGLINKTRDLAGAGDAVTGTINPEQASGAAIIAVRDAAALPLNYSVAGFRQFIEDIGLIWFDMWKAYNINGMFAGGLEVRYIPYDILRKMSVNVRIDISPQNPYSRYAKEQALENLLRLKFIDFSEYVAALDDDASAPKAKLSEIMERRKTQSAAPQEMILGAALDGQGMPQSYGGELR